MDCIRRFSSQPSKDLPAFFRQMVFNAAIGNTDDHLKNFSMLQRESGFCLSPVYDLLPDIFGKREHTLSFPGGAGNLAPDRAVFVHVAKHLQVREAREIIKQVTDAVSSWQAVFRRYQVPETDIPKLSWGIDRRLTRLKL